ncbi:MAG: DUF3450 domain-containing protein [Pseudomonadota bacterium]
MKGYKPGHNLGKAWRRVKMAPGLKAASKLAVAVLLAGALGAPAPQGLAQDDRTLRAIENEGVERNDERRGAQAAVDEVHDQTRRLIDAYRAELRIVEGLETYIEMLDAQISNQENEISTLQTSITDVAVIERQILPLLARMIDGLEQFVALDLPFLGDERSERVRRLRDLLTRSDVTVAEKARRVFEAYQIESDYGRTIEAYRAKLAVNGGSFDADFLRVGRVALIYRTVGDERLGFWDGDSWEALPDSPYRRYIEQGLKVARQEIAPELLTVPLATDRVEVQ